MSFPIIKTRYAAKIVHGSDNSVAIDLIATHIRRQLKERATRFRPQMATASRTTSPVIPPPPGWEKLIVIPETPQMKVCC